MQVLFTNQSIQWESLGHITISSFYLFLHHHKVKHGSSALVWTRSLFITVGSSKFPFMHQRKGSLHRAHISQPKVPLFVVSQLKYEKDAHIQQIIQNHPRKPARITKEMAKWASVKRPDEQNNRCHFGSPLLNRRQAPAPGSSGQGQKSPNKTAQLIVQSRNWIRQNCGKASSWWAGWKKSRPERVSKCNEESIEQH